MDKFSSLFTEVLGDFNARSTSWWIDDKTTTVGSHLEAFTSFHGLQQLMSLPTNILPDSTFCINFIFNDQPYLVASSGVHPTLHPNCRHQILHYKFNLSIEYPPPYERLVWDYEKANSESIKNFIEIVNWEAMFANKNVHEQVNIFNKILMNIFLNFTPNKKVIFDNKIPLVKTKINWKNGIYKTYVKMVVPTSSTMNLKLQLNLSQKFLTKEKRSTMTS